MTLRQIRFAFMSALLLVTAAHADDTKKCNSPAPECERAIRQMLTGKLYLGVQVQELNPGVRVKSIAPDSPAQRWGLGEGDRLMSLNGHSLLRGDIKEFKRILSEIKEAGERASFVVERGGTLKRIDVRLEPYSKAQIDKVIAQHLAEAHSIVATTTPQP
jgi:predicted metalloprotease with PDZ domain